MVQTRECNHGPSSPLPDQDPGPGGGEGLLRGVLLCQDHQREPPLLLVDEGNLFAAALSLQKESKR